MHSGRQTNVLYLVFSLLNSQGTDWLTTTIRHIHTSGLFRVTITNMHAGKGITSKFHAGGPEPRFERHNVPHNCTMMCYLHDIVVYVKSWRKKKNLDVFYSTSFRKQSPLLSLWHSGGSHYFRMTFDIPTTYCRLLERDILCMKYSVCVAGENIGIESIGRCIFWPTFPCGWLYSYFTVDESVSSS